MVKVNVLEKNYKERCKARTDYVFEDYHVMTSDEFLKEVKNVIVIASHLAPRDLFVPVEGRIVDVEDNIFDMTFRKKGTLEVVYLKIEVLQGGVVI